MLEISFPSYGQIGSKSFKWKKKKKVDLYVTLKFFYLLYKYILYTCVTKKTRLHKK